MADQVQQIKLNDAMKITLDNYYDILKAQAGGLGAKEYIQVKLVADGVDISDKVLQNENETSYEWFSYRNLRNRSDKAIDPNMVDDTVFTGAVQLSDVYGKFLSRLSSLTNIVDLSTDDQSKIIGYGADKDYNNDKIKELREKDELAWLGFCRITGADERDPFAKLNWRSAGNGGKII